MTRPRHLIRSLGLGFALLAMVIAVAAVDANGRSALAKPAQQTVARAKLDAFLSSLPVRFKQNSSIAQALVASLKNVPAVKPRAPRPAGMSIVEHSLPLGTVPIDIKDGPDGDVWFSYLRGMGQLNPLTGQITLYPSPLQDGVPYAVNGGPGPYMYFTSLVTDGFGNGIGRINVNTHQYQFFQIPTPLAYPADIKTGPDGNEWFSETLAGKIGVFNTTTLTIKEFDVGALTLPQDIATGEGSCETLNQCPPGIETPGGPLEDGNIWYTLMGVVPGLAYSKLPVGLLPSPALPGVRPHQLTPGNALLSINPETYVMHEYPYPTLLAGTLDVDPGPNNHTVYFAEMTGNKIGYIDTRTHNITEIPLPTPGAVPFCIGAGPKAFGPEMYFTEIAANAIGTYNPATGQIGELPVPIPVAGLIDLTQNSESNTMFFAEAVGNAIGEVLIS